jgi:3-oxocholest-4-en-26-oate---CoA ligase
MEFNLADLFEAAVDAYPERRTYAEMEAGANRLARQLAAQGIGPGDHVGRTMADQRGIEGNQEPPLTA